MCFNFISRAWDRSDRRTLKPEGPYLYDETPFPAVIGYRSLLHSVFFFARQTYPERVPASVISSPYDPCSDFLSLRGYESSPVSFPSPINNRIFPRAFTTPRGWWSARTPSALGQASVSSTPAAASAAITSTTPCATSPRRCWSASTSWNFLQNISTDAMQRWRTKGTVPLLNYREAGQQLILHPKHIYSGIVSGNNIELKKLLSDYMLCRFNTIAFFVSVINYLLLDLSLEMVCSGHQLFLLLYYCIYLYLASRHYILYTGFSGSKQLVN